MNTKSNKWNGTGLPAIGSFVRLVSYGHTQEVSSNNTETMIERFKFGQMYEVDSTDNKWEHEDGRLSIRIRNWNGYKVWALLDDFQLENSVPVYQSNVSKIFKRGDVAIARCIMEFKGELNYMERNGVEIDKAYTIEKWTEHYGNCNSNGPAVIIFIDGKCSPWLPADAFEKFIYTEGVPGWGTTETTRAESYDPTNLRVSQVKAGHIDQNPKVRITALEKINVPITDSYKAKNIPRNLVSQNRISIF